MLTQIFFPHIKKALDYFIYKKKQVLDKLKERRV